MLQPQHKDAMQDFLDRLKNGELTLGTLKNDYGIVIREYPDRYVFNYDQIDSHKQRFDPLVRLCRQLILSRDFRVLHRSFDRFFNYLEDPDSDSFDIAQAVCEEKLDGALVGVYFDGQRWCHCTRSMAFAEGSVAFKYGTFGELIDGETDITDHYSRMNPDCSYLFELMSVYDPHVTKVEGTRLYLLAVRNKLTGAYLDKHEEGRRIGWEFFPKEYRFRSMDEIMDNIGHLQPRDEGYVCRINDWRIKIKNPAHVALSHLKNELLSERRIIEIVHKCEDGELLAYMPEKRELFTPWIEVRERMKKFCLELYRNRYDTDRKTFALNLSDLPGKVRGVMFMLHSSQGDFDEIVRNMRPEAVEGLYKEVRVFLGI